MKEEQDIEILESYLQDKLNYDEKEDVENRLKTDTSFAALLYDIKILMEGIQENSRRQITLKLKKLEKEITEQEKRTSKIIPINRMHWAFGAAASVLLLVSLFFVLQRNQATHSEELFHEYFKPYTNVAIPSIRRQATMMPDAEAYQKYDQGKFEEVIVLFEGIDQKDAAIHLYLGNAYLATGNAGKAIVNFEECIQKSDTFRKQAEWYLALSYLKNNRTDKSISILRKIREDTGSYAPLAKRILKDLQKEKS